VEEPLDRIEDMAQYSLDAVRQVQPHGPYFLIGFSLGGLITLEMAQQLMAQGEKIGLLAMLDSYPNMRSLSLVQRTRLATRMAWRWAASRMQWLGVPAPYRTTIDSRLRRPCNDSERVMVWRWNGIGRGIIRGRSILSGRQFPRTSLPMRLRCGPIWRIGLRFRPCLAIILAS